jgi:phosphatidylinositol alpha 1,6-mannosyltransferase
MVDLQRFNPARYDADALPPGFNVLHAGPLNRDDGIELLAQGFLLAHDRNPRLRLVLACDGPDQPWLSDMLGDAATFLRPADPDELARVFASADLFVHTSPTAGSILIAQASGLPVLAIDAPATRELIENGRSGCLVAAEPEAFGAALAGLARRGAICDRLATGGLLTIRVRLAAEVTRAA